MSQVVNAWPRLLPIAVCNRHFLAAEDASKLEAQGYVVLWVSDSRRPPVEVVGQGCPAPLPRDLS